MMPDPTHLAPTWRMARRTARMNPSIVREILKVTERPEVISLAGGLPSPDTFPVEAVREATQRILQDAPREALQYAASEGFAPLREWVAEDLRASGMSVGAEQVLITTGSQQGLDLVGKLLIDAGSRVAVESPTFLGALQAFATCEAEFEALPCDAEGACPEHVRAGAGDARFLYLQPNFQNPTGRCTPASRRADLVRAAQAAGLPLVEDNPYGDLWFDTPPPAPLASCWPEGVVYLGSFSKVLAPGLRLGYVVAPRALAGKLLQAKQAADLHTPGLNQRLVHEVVRDGFLADHLPGVRAICRERRDAMASALAAHLPAGCHWTIPAGGMFFWVDLPAQVDTMALLQVAVALGVAFVPGASFHAGRPAHHQLRLSFVTVSPERIDQGIRLLAQAIHIILTSPETPSR